MFSGILSALLSLPFALTVCNSGCAYSSLQGAIHSASEGEEIVVTAGDYREPLPITVDKPVAIRGVGDAILHGDGSHDVLLVTAKNVVIENLTIRDGGNSYTHEIAAIRTEAAANCKIRDNRLENNAFGIYLANSEGCVVTANRIRGADANDSEAGNGIHSWSGSHHIIEGNIVENHRDGIYIEFTTDSVIRSNTTQGNLRYGLHFMSAHRNQYEENRFAKNGAGVAVMYSRDIRMLRNTFADNTGSAAYGLLLKDISSGIIKENAFLDNTIGIYMEGTNRSLVQGNAFLRNGYGLRILADCDDNTLEENDFIGNTFDVATNSSRNPNRFSRNYWGNYDGYDLNFDGVGDVPYRPVSLSSVLVEKFDSTYLLIKSPLFFALDQVEQAFPVLIPETMKDDSPLMIPLHRSRVFTQ